MRRRHTHPNRLLVTVTLCFAMLGFLMAPVSLTASVQAGPVAPYTLDVLEGYLWSSSTIYLAPGQTIVITNRDVARHTFTVDAWEIDVTLPSLVPVEVVVPNTAEPGETVEFYSAIPGDREGGLTGTITVVPAEEIVAGQRLDPNLAPPAPEPRVRIEARDDFTFQPAIATVGPGTLVQVVNTGVISHHFVVDAWEVNQTIAAGTMVLVRVPADARIGSTIDFYCSIPGHQQQGMVGVLRITGDAGDIGANAQVAAGDAVPPIDMRPFVPEAGSLGDGWSKLRGGSSDSILGDRDLSSDVFPYAGIGAVYVGPNGARVSVVVVPLQTEAVPINQVSDAVRAVQGALAEVWAVDRVASAAWRSIPPPNGCTVADRVAGIVPVVTLPGGVTSCQLTGVGVVLFVAVEGEYLGETGVDASNLLVERIVGGELMAERNKQ